MKTVLATVGVVAALALTGTALGNAAADATNDRTSTAAVADLTTGPAPKPSVTPEDRPTIGAVNPGAAGATNAGAVSAGQAETIAVARLGGGRVIDMEAELEHGRQVWKVEILLGNVEHRVDIDRATGEVVRVRHESSAKRSSDDLLRGQLDGL
jgi:uncharacterized membrane protein YkoI